MPKSGKKIRQLQQALIALKTPEFNTWGEFLEQLVLNTADALDSISGSGLLVRGELITTYLGFSLRILSSLLKLYLVFANWEQEEKADSIFSIVELLIVIMLTLLTIILEALIAAIMGILLAIYFFLKDAASIGKLLFTLFEEHTFNHWLEGVLIADPSLFFETGNPVFKERLFFQKIRLQRQLCREPDPVLQMRYEALCQVTKCCDSPESANTLRNLYAELNQHFERLEALIQAWEPDKGDILLNIQQVFEKTRDLNQEINAFAGCNHWNPGFFP